MSHHLLQYHPRVQRNLRILVSVRPKERQKSNPKKRKDERRLEKKKKVFNEPFESNPDDVFSIG